MREPVTNKDWQEAVDAASFMLHVDSAEKYGLITGPEVNVERCETILRRGAAMGHHPRPIDAILAGGVSTDEEGDVKQRGMTPEEDRERGWIEEGVITEVTPYSDGGGWSVGYGSMGCGVRDVGVEPKVGDTLTTFGQIGYSFHGQALNGRVLWYLSPEEEEAEHRAAQERREQEKRDTFEANRAKLDADYDSLPDTFKERIDKFRQTNPNFRWEFEPYEMMCCKDALRIASYCSVNRLATEFEGNEPTAAENVIAYGKLPFEEQKKAGIEEGNSFGFACRLAWWWVTDPGMVVKEHGALTPLTGCVDYGCPHPDEEPESSGGDE